MLSFCRSTELHQRLFRQGRTSGFSLRREHKSCFHSLWTARTKFESLSLYGQLVHKFPASASLSSHWTLALKCAIFFRGIGEKKSRNTKFIEHPQAVMSRVKIMRQQGRYVSTLSLMNSRESLRVTLSSHNETHHLSCWRSISRRDKTRKSRNGWEFSYEWRYFWDETGWRDGVDQI